MKNKYIILKSILFVVTLNLNSYSLAEETVLEKTETVKNKAVDQVKSSYRDAKDKTCEMIDGKMNCVVKKIKHKAQSSQDKSKTDTKEILNKID